MPKVRASSAMMGTMRLPSAGSLRSAPIMRTKATVVDISLPPASSANFANAPAAGVATGSQVDTRAGRYPPSFSRRACR